MPGINSSLTVQSSNFVQSNDLVYRTALELTGFAAPLYYTSRNKEERRENLFHSTLVTGVGFVLIPLEVLGLNKLFASKFFNKNDAFFRLKWNDLDQGKGKSIEHLQKHIKRSNDRLKTPSWFDKVGFVNNGIKKNIGKMQDAIKVIENDPSVLKKVYKSKRNILLVDLLFTTTALVSIPPIKVFFTKHFQHKDRFTGTQNYLSDNDLHKLVKKDKNSDIVKKAITGLLCTTPFIAALATHKITKANLDKGLKPNKTLMKLRNSMDYTNGIYLSLGGLIAVFQSLNFNAINWARDKYERRETIIKLGLAVPSFWFGDYIFNGNISKTVDKILNNRGLFEKGTFIKQDKANIFGSHSREIKEVIEQVEQKHGKQKANLAGKIATGVFIAGFAAHSTAMCCIFNFANKITRKRVKTDLTKINSAEIAQNPQSSTIFNRFSEFSKA